MKRRNNEGSIFYNSSRNRWNAQYKIKDVVLKDIMGHYNIEITKNIYIDIQENYEQEEVKKVEKYLKKVGIIGK